MPDPVMSRDEFLELSTRIFDDLRRWVLAASQYHNLTPKRLGVLNEATEIIEQETILLTGGTNAAGGTTPG